MVHKILVKFDDDGAAFNLKHKDSISIHSCRRPVELKQFTDGLCDSTTILFFQIQILLLK